MEFPSPVIITKVLLPGKRRDLLRRQRLVDFIHGHIERKLIIVSAPAGYGKTSLLIDYAHDTDFPVCWYSLGESDQDPGIFLEYLVASIRKRFPNFGRRVEALLRGRENFPQEMEAIVGVLVNELYETIPEYFVVVLDDYHFVDESEFVNTFMDTLLYYLPENCHILLASRTLPRLTLTRLVAKQQVAGLGVNDLRFNAGELQALMRQNHNLDLPDSEAEELAAQFEGWITGIQLTTHTMWRGLFEGLIRARRAEVQVFDYLTTEVFAQQSEEVRQFLLASSILERMNPALCNELLGISNSQEILDFLENRNLFIVHLEGDGPWYRYHHLFQEFLEGKLRNEGPDRYTGLHEKAAHIFEVRGSPQEAIDHYLKAEAHGEAAQLIEEVAEETFKAGRWRTLAGWIDALPEDMCMAKPQLLLSRASIYREVGELDKAIELFDQAELQFAAGEERSGIAKAQVLKSIALRFKGDHQEAIRICGEVLSTLDERDVSIIAQARKNIGICYGMRGELPGAIEALKGALQLYEQVGDLYNVAHLHHDLGTAYILMGNTRNSLGHYQRALQYWRRLSNPAALGNALNSIGVLRYYQGNYEEALKTLEEALDKAQSIGYLRVEATILASLGDVYRDLGEHERALEVYEEAFSIAEQVNETLIVVQALDALGNIHRLLGDSGKAEELITRALEEGQDHQLGYGMGLCQTSLGILCYERGDVQQALEHLTQARELFERCEAKRELARAHLHLAQTFYLGEDSQEALQHLEAALELTSQLGYDQFLVVEGQRALPLLKYAVAQGVENEVLTQVLERINKHISRIATGRAPKSAPEVLPAAVPTLKIYALGPAKVEYNSCVITKTQWDSALTKELFFYFVAHPQGLRKEQVMGVFWADSSQDNANSSFHSTNYRLRRALFHECVIHEDGLYYFNRQVPYWYDVEEFESLIKKAEKLQGDSEERAEYYHKAIELYRGDYLEEVYHDWCMLRREELREKYFSALTELAAFEVSQERVEEAIELYKKILARDDYREEVHREVMRCYALAGDRAMAIRYYKHLVKFLQEELEVPPMPETEEVYQAIVRGEIG
jgi:LuxR family maltose regulon positive regulatory protein